MKVYLKFILGLFLTLSLTGCIGEEYDFTPPSVTLSNTDSVESVELEEASINWRGENSEQIKKETGDILTFASKQKPLNFNAGQKLDLLFDSEDFDVNELSVTVWKNDEEIKLELDDHRSFNLPKDKGEYVIVVDLQTDRGSAQYVGNIVIK